MTSPLIGFDNVSEGIMGLFDASSSSDFFRSLAWFQTLASAGYNADCQVRTYLSEKPGEPAGLVLGTTPPGLGGLGLRSIKSLTNFYSCGYAPLLLDETKPAALDPIIDQLIDERPRWDVIHLDSLDHDGPLFTWLIQTFAARGWPVQSYFHFGNWYENTTGLTATQYFAARPGQLRNTLKRQANKMAKTASSSFKIFTSEDDIEAGIAHYETVYATSWKGSEPFASFAAALIRGTAAIGCLRLGIMMIDDVPAAAQIWIVWRGKATIFKLAHDQRYTALSPGSLLTRHMMEQVLSEGGIREIDFGRGDDPYKQLWLSQRRERWGIMAFNPTTLRGRAAALRNLAPATLRRLHSRLRSSLKI